MAPVIQHPYQHEERAGRNTVIDHLVDGAFDAPEVEGKNAEHDEAEVSHGRIGDQFFQVRLDHGDKRTVEDTDDGENTDEGRKLLGCVGEERQAEAEHPVSPHLQQDARQDHRPRRGRFHVRVGEPGVKRKHGDLDREGQEERPEKPGLGRCWQRLPFVGQFAQDGHEVESARHVVEV